MYSTKENLQVLHEDNHIIVVNKRAGDIVQGDKTGDKPLSDIAKKYIKKKTQKTRKCFFRNCSSFGQAYLRYCYLCPHFKSFGTFK